MSCLLLFSGSTPALENRLGLFPYSAPQQAQSTLKWNTSLVERFSRIDSTNCFMAFTPFVSFGSGQPTVGSRVSAS